MGVYRPGAGGTATGTDPNQEYTHVVYSYFEVGYLLATNPYGHHYRLLRLEVEEVVVFDAEAGMTSQVGFRFYDGTQTEPDAVVRKYVEENPGANFGDILLFLPVAEYDRVPRVRAVISSTAVLNTAEQETEIVSLVPGPQNLYIALAGYDSQTGLLYQVYDETDFFPVLSSPIVVTYSMERRREVSRVNWGGPASPGNVVALQGSGYLVCSDQAGPPYAVALVDPQTGQQVATADPSGAKASQYIYLTASVSATNVLPGRWLAMGNYSTVHTGAGDTNSAIVVCDVAGQTVTIIDSTVCLDRNTMICPGRRRLDSSSFFVGVREFGDANGASTLVQEVVWAGEDQVYVNDIVEFTDGQIVDSLGYDPQTGYLAVATSQGTTYRVHLVNPRDGLIVDTVSSPARLVMTRGDLLHSVFLNAQPGHVLLPSLSTSDVYDLNVASRSITSWADGPTSDPLNAIYDQTRDMYLEEQQNGEGNDRWFMYRQNLLIAEEIPLQTAIEQVMELAGYTTDQLTFSGFDSTVKCIGYVIGRSSTVNQVLQTMADIYDFSFCDTGDGYYFRKIVKTGSVVSDGDVSDADLVYSEGGSVYTSDKAQQQTIQRLDFKYVSRENGYQANNVHEARPRAHFDVTNSVREESVDAPIVMHDEEMQRLVTQRLYQSVVGSRNHQLATVPDLAHLVPGDVVTVPVGEVTYTTQITGLSLGSDMSVTIESIDISEDVEVEVDTVSNTPDLPTLPTSYATNFVLLDIPLIDLEDDAGGTALVQYGVLTPVGQDNWLGGILYTGTTPDDVQYTYAQAPTTIVTGAATTVLAAPETDWMRDDVNSVTISLTNGDAADLSSETETRVLLGANLAFLGQPGRWEGIAFEDVADNGDGTVTLSGFTMRGWGGTEEHEHEHAVGDVFVLVDPDYTRRLASDVSLLDQIWYYRAIGTGSRSGGAVRSASSPGIAETPYAPVNLDAVVDGSDIDITWDYRSRLSAWEFFDVSPDSGEATLSFEVDIMDGGTVLRTLTTSTNSVTYTAADITTDWGSMPASLTFRVYMMSAVVGRGRVAEATRSLS